MAEKHFILAGGGGTATALGDREVGADGVPVQRFKRQMLRPATYTHPVDGWKWEVTEKSLQKLCDDSNKLLELGHPIEATMDHGQGAAAVLGYVGKLAVEDGVDPAGKACKWLVAEHEYRGDEAIRIAQANRNVSIEVDEFKDALGHKFDEVVLASSLVQKPVVTGQAGALRKAASIRTSKGTQVPVLFLSNSGTGKRNSQKGSSMEPDVMTKLLSLIEENLGITEDLTEENALSVLQGYFDGKKARFFAMKSSLAKAADDLELAIGVAARVPELEAELEASQTERKRLSLQVDATAVAAPVAEVLAGTFESRITNLQTAGKLSPESGRKLLAALVGAKGARRKLSMSGTDVVVALPINEVLDIIDTNEPKKLGLQTSKQTGTSEIKPGNAGQIKTFEDEVKEAQEQLKKDKPPLGN